MYKWLIAWRYLHTKLIAIFGIGSVMLCVAMVLVVLSVMGGFLDTIRERSRGLHSEIVLEGGTLQGIPYYAEFGDYLKKELPETVRITTPVIYTYGIFRVPATTYTKPCRVLGIRLDEYPEVNDFGDGLYYDKYYPGTTHLGQQTQPIAGLGADGEITLPRDLEQANQQWQKQADADDVAAYKRHAFNTTFHPYITPDIEGERVFAMDIEEPRYDGAERDGIIVGCDLLNKRRKDGNFDRYIARGAEVALTLMPLTPSGNSTGEPPIRLPMRYVDDSRTGIFEIDELCVYVDFDMVQRKLAMDPQQMIDGGMTPARANQLLIGLTEGSDLDGAKKEIDEVWQSFRESMDPMLTEMDRRVLGYAEVYTWEDLQRPFIAAVEKEKVLVTLLFGMISLVAIVLIGCIFYMIVEKKTRDIGILKAVGASSRGVATIFIVYAFAVGVVGAILGTLVGSAFVWNINAIQDALAQLHPQLRVWSPDVYSFDKIPEIVKRGDALWVASLAVVSSIVGSLIPATLAGRIWPVGALRYE